MTKSRGIVATEEARDTRLTAGRAGSALGEDQEAELSSGHRCPQLILVLVVARGEGAGVSCGRVLGCAQSRYFQ